VGVGRRPALPLEHFLELRERMRRRGPDAAGLADLGHVRLGHRRLSVVAPGDAGAQPMTRPGAGTIVYNGELYNDVELRRELAARGHVLDSESDTLTILTALKQWGIAAFSRLRGMYALAWLNATGSTLTLARDPLGIKPLHYTFLERDGGLELVFASDAAVVAGARPSLRPDLVTVSSYLTTIRTTLGARTMFEGVHCLQPGEVMECDLRQGAIAVRRITVPLPIADAPSDPADVGAVVRDSLRRHLRSDVGTCSLLSGGLDSSIIASLASEQAGGELRTYCAGAGRGIDQDGDHAHAAAMASWLGSRHTAVDVTRELFIDRWPEMIMRQGLPLSTPNEVAINEVARTLRAAGDVVALSGEGADELFGGYLGPMLAAWRFERERSSGSMHPGVFQLEDAAWVPLAAKEAILQPDAFQAIEADSHLTAWYREAFDRVADERHNLSSLDPHLRFMRRVNLSGLLARLDSAMMLEGVEGRTPFADLCVASFAEGLAMEHKFHPVGGKAGVVDTKICLRRAFASRMLPSVVSRPKASFPLPFHEWVGDAREALLSVDWMREVFTEAALHAVEARAGELWRLSWPMINLALWAQRWWGDPSATRTEILSGEVLPAR
jgi:asparagine synthase (glutamine-hydrolysing)